MRGIWEGDSQRERAVASAHVAARDQATRRAAAAGVPGMDSEAFQTFAPTPAPSRGAAASEAFLAAFAPSDEDCEVFAPVGGDAAMGAGQAGGSH